MSTSSMRSKFTTEDATERESFFPYSIISWSEPDDSDFGLKNRKRRFRTNVMDRAAREGGGRRRGARAAR